MKEIEFDTFFKIQAIGMKLTLSHPDMKHDIYWLLKNIIVYGPYTLTFAFLCNSVVIDMRAKDYFNAFRNIVPMTMYICIMFQYLVLIRNCKTIGRLIQLMRADFGRVTQMNKRNKSIMITYMANSSWIMKRWLVLLISSVIIFIIKAIIISIYHAAKGDYRFVPFHELYYTEYIDKLKRSNIFVYFGTFMLETYFATTCGIINLCSLPLGPIFMIHVCGLLELIITKFENIFEKDNVNERLKEIIKDLQYAYSFVTDINTCFTFMYEILLKQTTILLPVIAYAIVKSISHGKFTIEYVTLLAVIALLSTPCYYSDKLMSKGEEVRQAAYACGWERNFKPTARKTLLLILARAYKPITIRSIFHVINLDTLADVYRQAYTIFNLMTAMWD